MSHGRAVVKAEFHGLLSSLTTTGDRAYLDKIFPLSDDDFPCLVISASEEEIDKDASTADGIWRVLRVEVMAYAQRTSDLVSTLDTINSEVDTALAGASLVDILTIWPESCELTIESEGEQPVGVLNMVYAVEYRTLGNGDIA